MCNTCLTNLIEGLNLQDLQLNLELDQLKAYNLNNIEES